MKAVTTGVAANVPVPKLTLLDQNNRFRSRERRRQGILTYRRGCMRSPAKTLFDSNKIYLHDPAYTLGMHVRAERAGVRWGGGGGNVRVVWTPVEALGRLFEIRLDSVFLIRRSWEVLAKSPSGKERSNLIDVIGRPNRRNAIMERGRSVPSSKRSYSEISRP